MFVITVELGNLDKKWNEFEEHALSLLAATRHVRDAPHEVANESYWGLRRLTLRVHYETQQFKRVR